VNSSPRRSRLTSGQLELEHLADAGEQLVGRRAGEADRHLPHHAVVYTARFGCRGVHLCQHLAGTEQEPLPSGRELDPAGRPDQELDADLGLELLDLLRQRGLGDVEPLGRAAEVALLGHGDVVAQVTQLHWVRLSLSHQGAGGAVTRCRTPGRDGGKRLPGHRLGRDDTGPHR
jgi:hypothetical protein